MIIMNNQMEKNLLAQNSKKLDEKTIIYFQAVVNKTKLIKDCVIYDEGICEKNIDLEQIMKFTFDLTGYEIGCNEFRVEKSFIKDNEYQKIAINMHEMLKTKYEGRKFAVYVCVNDDYIEIRFYTYRQEEGLWLDEDLNNYENPVLYVI